MFNKPKTQERINKKNIVSSFCFPVSLFFCFCGIVVLLFPKNAKSENNTIEIPIILPRSTWFADNLKGLSDWAPKKDNFPPDYRKVDRIIIHHSAGTNDIPNPIATIQSIYRYHAVTQGWSDIGYNYIIDREGKIYEGRTGGNGVRGAHVYARSDCLNFNHGSIGIVLLGNYSTEEPPTAMYEAAAKLVGWLAEVNGLDPAQTAYRSMVWQDKKTGSTCDSSLGGFTYNHYGPVVIGHKDVDNTGCPGIISLSKIRLEASKYAEQYQNLIYKITNEKAYQITNGYAQLIINDQLSMINSDNVIEISKSQLELFMNKDYYRYSDGSLLSFGTPSVYVVEGGKLREFKSAADLAKLGFNLNNVINLAKTDKNLYEIGLAVNYGPDGKLLASENTVYYIENGRKRGITSAALFESLGFSWKSIESVSQETMSSYLAGDIMRYKPGSLLAIGPTVYAYNSDGGTSQHKLHGITSAALFETLGYKWDDIIIMPEHEVNLYETGDIKRYPSDTLIAAEANPAVFRINNSKRQAFSSAELFENLGYKWDKIIKTSSDEIALYPYESSVKYPDGFVLRQEKDSTVYVIESGKKKPFTSEKEFLEAGHKWKDVIVLREDDLGSYELASSTKLAENSPRQDTRIQENKDTNQNSNLKTQEVENNKNETEIGNQKLENNTAENKLASLTIPTNNSQQQETTGVETDNTNILDTKYLIPDTVKVALKSFAKNIRITSENGGYNVKDAGGNVIYSSAAGTVYTAAYSNNIDLIISGDSDSTVLKIYSIDDIVIDSANPFHPGYGGASDNVFIGSLRIKYSPVSNKCWAINELPLEDYVKGVAEVSEDLPLEYLKAMSVIIRTYVSYHASNGGKHIGEPFDLKNSVAGNGDDQVYKGYGFTKRAPIFSSAADSTKGQIITYNDKPILAAYSSDSGGVSKDARKVWPSQGGQGRGFDDKPYLYGGVSDPASTTHNAYAVSISHGAGLSAAGAKEMARLGSIYKEIIMHYYPGVSLTPNPSP